MNALLYALSDTNRLRTFLFWYWLISPLIFFFYQFAVSQGEQVDFRQMLNEPAIALAFMVSCMSIIMTGLLKAAETENEGTERIFGIFAVIQQLLTGNIPGFLLSYFYTRSLWQERGYPFAPRLRWVLIGGMALLGFLSGLTLLAYINLSLV
ncbi:MAG: cell shape determination protein CcmA [Rothia sp. (in: high G+C Gram-positive bacteria)]|nr:cell shape determination protein CcmA [Rothia sp. (in: high G+C Gram-positive bacteria)]